MLKDEASFMLDNDHYAVAKELARRQEKVQDRQPESGQPSSDKSVKWPALHMEQAEKRPALSDHLGHL
jgi:hypothetical protein